MPVSDLIAASKDLPGYLAHSAEVYVKLGLSECLVEELFELSGSGYYWAIEISRLPIR